MALAAGVAGTCVSITEHSGGFPTAAFFFQSAMCLVAATLSLVLVDGLGEGEAGRGKRKATKRDRQARAI